jgi:hypothetical protein
MPPSSKHKWYYAMALGRRPGVYTDWGQAEKQVNGFSGSLHKKFKDKPSAQRFVRKHQEQDNEDESETSSGVSDDDDPEDRSEGEDQNRKGRRKNSTRGGRKDQRGDEGFPPLELTAPDPSTGNSKELCRMTLAGDQQMIEKLSPPGLDARTKEALADATLDAIQLPGTSLSEVADNTGDLVGALREMTEDR